MTKIAIVTDSTAYLTNEDIKKYDIHVLPLSISFGTETYRETVDIQSKEFFQRMEQEEELPTSSQPAVGEFIKLYEKLGETYDAIISIHLSSKISGTFQSAQNVSQMMEDVVVHAIDSKVTVYAQAFLAIKAAKMAEEGKSVDEILQTLDQMIKYANALFVVDDLTNLIKGGRVSKFAGSLATFLKIKPVLTFEDGEIVPKEKIRTKKKAKAYMTKAFSKAVNEIQQPLTATIMYSGIQEEADEFKEELEAKFPKVSFNMRYFGPVIGVHVGKGALGLSWTINPE